MICYKIKLSDKSNKVLWELTIKDPESYKGGEEKTAEKVDLHHEEELI